MFKNHHLTLAAPFALLLLSGCMPHLSERFKESELPAFTNPPPVFDYSVHEAELQLGNSIYPLIPFVIPPSVNIFPSSLPEGFRISPTLPIGLSMDPRSGVISGCPTTRLPWTTYSVVAWNAGGTRPNSIRLRVYPEGAPNHFGYPFLGATSWRGVVLKSVTPTLEGMPPFTFSINPPLPKGLTLDPSTGTLSGTPTSLSDHGLYEVSVSNAVDCTTTSLRLSVEEGQLPLIAYPTTTFAAEIGQPLQALVPRQDALPAAEFFTVNPPLPGGLNLDPSTGKLFGTPNTPSSMAPYQVTATNPLGTTTTSLLISTVPTGWPAIHSFTVTQYRDTESNLTYLRLNWTVTAAFEIRINDQRVLYSYLDLPSPSTIREFTMTAQNANGTSTARIVLPPLM